MNQTTIDLASNEPAPKALAIITAEDSTEDLLYEFLRDRSPTTERSYRQDLKDFFNFTREHFNLPATVDTKVDFKTIRRVHVVKWKNFLESQPTKRGGRYAPNSINRKLSSVASFYQFLLQREVVDKNPVEFCQRPKRINIRDTEAFDAKEMKDFFQLVMRRANPMHRAVLLLLFTTGMRNAEARNIRLQDFEMKDGVRVLKYVGKGQKVNYVPIHPITSRALGHYLEWMEENGRKILPQDYLFQASKKKADANAGNKLSHTALGYIVKKWARKINMAKRITPHSARSTFISCLLAQGEDIYTVARCVNHSSVNTTARYDRRKRNFNKSPVFGLDFF